MLNENNNNFLNLLGELIHVASYTRSDGTFVREYWRRRHAGESFAPETRQERTKFDLPPFAPESDESGEIMNFDAGSVLGGIGSAFEKIGEAAKNAAEKAGEVFSKTGEAAKNAGDVAGDVIKDAGTTAGDVIQNTPDVVNDVPLFELSVSMNEHLEKVADITKSGIMDTLKDTMSKIDTDEIVEKLSNAVKNFRQVLDKYPELQSVYDKFQSVRAQATVYRLLDKQKIYKDAQKAKNTALTKAKELQNELQQMTTTKLPQPKSAGGSISYAPDVPKSPIKPAQPYQNPLSNPTRTMRIPSMLDIRTPAGARFTNPYYTNLEPLESRLQPVEFEGKTYKTRAELDKEMKGYAVRYPKGQKIVAQNVNIPITPYASEYYQIALNGVTDVGPNNITYKLYKIPDRELVNFIQQHYGVSSDIDVVTPTLNSGIRDIIVSSKYFKNGMLNAIQRGLPKHFSIAFPKDYTPTDIDLYTTFHNVEIYDSYVGYDGNIHLILVDYYDFDKMSGDNLFVLINNNAYVQQELGMLKNYVIIIPMIVSVDDLI